MVSIFYIKYRVVVVEHQQQRGRGLQGMPGAHGDFRTSYLDCTYYAGMNKKYLAIAPLAVLTFAFSASPAHSQSDSRLAFLHVTVLDVKTGELKPDMTVLTGDGRITEIGKAAALRAPQDAGLFEGSGKYMIPALWNMHVHSVGYGAA